MSSVVKFLLLFLVLDPRIVFDHNPNDIANREFKFKNLPSPSKDDAGSRAKLTLIDGELEEGSAELAALTDGRVPRDEDQHRPGLSPSARLFPLNDSLT